WQPQPAPPPSPQPSYPAPPPPAAPAGWQQQQDSWMSGGQRAPAQPNLYEAPGAQAPIMPPTSGSHVRTDLATANANPIMRAASGLLLLLGRLRASLSRGHHAQLMDQVAQAVAQFEVDVRAAGVSPEQTVVAKYALCATADDIVQNLPGDDRHLWTQYSMLARYFGERTGGVRFFSELDRAKANPALNHHLLELFHACLCLGFEGVHRTSQAGAGALQQIRRDVYETIRRVRDKTIEDLSPHWRGQLLGAVKRGLSVPVWSVAVFAGVLLFAVYLALRAFLGDSAEVLAGEMNALHPDTEIGFVRLAPTPPPPAVEPAGSLTQLERIRGALTAEIDGGQIGVEQTSNVIVVRIANLALFESGQANVIPAFEPIAARLAAMLEQEAGFIRVIGHSDNVPIKTVTFPSNFVLSEARAKSVAELLKRGLSDPGRIEVEGKGADKPVASNKTAEGRAQNRRVEIVIPRERPEG
ncbi:type VI secretion system protein TssL, long form, partial [Methylobrevis albus]